MRQTRAGKDGAVDDGLDAVVPTFDLVADDIAADAAKPRLFDFGNDPDLPDTAPIAVLPPWMRATVPAAPPVEPEPRRGRPVPRARAHRRPYVLETPVEAPVVEVLVEAPLVEAPAPKPAPRTVAEAAAAAAEAAAFLKVAGDIAAPAEPAAPVVVRPAYPQAAPAPIAAPAPARTATTKAARGDRARRIATIVGVGMIGVSGLGALYIGTVGTPSAPVPLPDSQLAANQWVVDNIGSTASVLAPAAVTKALTKGGFDAGRLVPYADGASGSTGSVTNPSWNCCNVLFVTSPAGDSSVRDGLPVSLRPAYDQSRALASFTSAGQTTELRQVLNGTKSEIAASLDSEHTVLVNAGKEVLASKKLHLSAQAKEMVTAGEVDSRVLLAIVGLASRHDVSVLDFPIGDPEQAVDGLAREVRIDKLDGKPLAVGSAAVGDADGFLGMQVDPYKPATLALTDPDGSGSTLLDIRYDAPGPLGLITPGTK
ncbi:MAG TPA: hypothetical protein VGL04_00525 [Sporichthyaceae bacterium]